MSQGNPTLNLRIGRGGKSRITPRAPKRLRGLHTAMVLCILVVVLPEFAYPGDTATWAWSKGVAFVLCLTLATRRQRLVRADTLQTIPHEPVDRSSRGAGIRQRDQRRRAPVQDVTLIEDQGLGLEIPHDHWSELYHRRWGTVPKWHEFQRLVHTVNSRRDGE